MACSKGVAILMLLMALLILVIAIGVLYRLCRPRYIELEELISNEPNLTTPLLGHWRNSWTNSWSDSWTNSWGWLRREKHDQLLPTSHLTSKSSLVSPPPTREDTAPSIKVNPAERPLQYTILSGGPARRVPNASPTYLDRITSQKIAPWDIDVFASPEHWRKAKKSRKSRPSRGRSISPYRPSSGCYHSEPIKVPSKKERRPRPTFPLPEKLIWKALTPYERAGMVWYRNAAY